MMVRKEAEKMRRMRVPVCQVRRGWVDGGGRGAPRDGVAVGVGRGVDGVSRIDGVVLRMLLICLLGWRWLDPVADAPSGWRFVV